MKFLKSGCGIYIQKGFYGFMMHYHLGRAEKLAIRSVHKWRHHAGRYIHWNHKFWKIEKGLKN